MKKIVNTINVNEIIKQIVTLTKDTFKDNLVGVYLHGSLVMNCFNPYRSDIDYIVVVKEDASLQTKIDYLNGLLIIDKLCPKKGLEMSIVLEKDTKNFSYLPHFILHFSNYHKSRVKESITDYCLNMKGYDKDLAAHFVITKKYGKRLYGKEIEEVFGEVPDKDYFDSIWEDIKDDDNEILDNSFYYVLNLCRVLAFVKDGLILSKLQGGKYFINNYLTKNTKQEYIDLVNESINIYTSQDDLHKSKETITDEIKLKFKEEIKKEILSLIH